MGIAGLVLGIIALVFCWVPILGQILGILGLVFSIIGVARRKHRGPGIGGLITSGISLCIGITIIFLYLVMGPNTMKWIDSSRMSTDQNNYDAVVSSCNIALADCDVMEELAGKKVVITAMPDGWSININCPEFRKVLDEVLGEDWETSMRMRYSDNDNVTITIQNYTVTRSNPPCQ